MTGKKGFNSFGDSPFNYRCRLFSPLIEPKGRQHSAPSSCHLGGLTDDAPESRLVEYPLMLNAQSQQPTLDVSREILIYIRLRIMFTTKNRRNPYSDCANSTAEFANHCESSTCEYSDNHMMWFNCVDKTDIQSVINMSFNLEIISTKVI